VYISRELYKSKEFLNCNLGEEANLLYLSLRFSEVGKLGYGNRLLALAYYVPARIVPEMRKQGMDACLRFRIPEIEFRAAIFTRYQV
jgi:hypothetical protein